MNVYRLEPIDQDDPSWESSNEKNIVWVAADSAIDARVLVAAKTGGSDARSPWRDAALTSCDLEPDVAYVNPGTVVREDGSLVGD